MFIRYQKNYPLGMSRRLLYLQLPFVDSKGEIIHGLNRLLPSNLKHLPRIGESVYVLAGVYPKIESIQYSGHNLHYVKIILEPIPVAYRTELEKNKDLKGKSLWQTSYSGYPVDLGE